LKIVYLAGSIIPSKTANSLHIMKMCEALGRENVVELVTMRSSKEIDINDSIHHFYNIDNKFKIIKIPFNENRKGKWIEYYFRIFRFLLKRKANLVFGRFLEGCYLASILKIKTIYEIHAPINKSFKRKVFFFKLIGKSKYCKKIVVITKGLKDKMTEDFPEFKEKYFIASDCSDEVKDFSKRKLFFTNYNLNVGYVGHLYSGKGMEIIQKIAPKMESTNFHIIGGTEEDISYWKQIIESENIHFYGFIPQNKLSSYINSLDICLLPNQNEILASGSSKSKKQNISEYTSPLKLFNYMAHKKAIIASDLPVLREVLNEKNSMLVDPENEERWIEAIKELNNIKKRELLASNAYIDFISNYTWEKRIIKILNEK